MENIISELRSGDDKAASLLIRRIEEGGPEAKKILKQIFPYTGGAYVLGITGSPGVGKSTLTDCLIGKLRSMGSTVGVLGVDPTSPFSGGAVLGDRIRMQSHAADDAVFIRSLATRGHFGGLTKATRGAMMVLDAMGKDFIIIETVGVGQDEVDICRIADTTITVLMPGVGDEVQSIKAGILEVADVFAINKSDREGAERTIQELQLMLHMEKLSGAQDTEAWEAPIIKTVAIKNHGLDELWEAIEKHRIFLNSDKRVVRSNQDWLKGKQELMDLVKLDFMNLISQYLEGTEEFNQFIDDFVAGTTDPFTLSEKLISRLWQKMKQAELL